MKIFQNIEHFILRRIKINTDSKIEEKRTYKR